VPFTRASAKAVTICYLRLISEIRDKSARIKAVNNVSFESKKCHFANSWNKK
jgi:hypothetical protein